METNDAALVSAKAQLEVRQLVRTSLAVRLIDPTGIAAPTNPACCVQIRALVTGRILKIIQDSEAVVQAGAPLIDIGDPVDIEVVADLVSTDAVQLKMDAPVRIDGWGGPLVQGCVIRVDPAGFVKVSALGIEEQRVRTTIDFADPPDTWSRLGHDYRVSCTSPCGVPVGALFRQGEDWAVFTLMDGRVNATVVTIGHRNGRMAEVMSGLSAGDRVILHPSDNIKKGVPVSERESE